MAFTPVSSGISLLRRWVEESQRAEPYKMAAASAPAQSLDKITFFKIG
jgi:hypothetical protein